MELQNSNRVLKKSWNSNDDFFLFEEHCLATHFSANTMMEEDDVRKTFWKIKEGDVVIDVGASHGSYTLPALSSGAFVYAFEPSEYMYKSLRNNLILNKFENRCIIEQKALWNKTGEKLKFSVNNLNIFHFGSVAMDDLITELDSITLDDYFKNDKPSKINWIKIDVDGAEVDVLEGARNTLKRFKPRILVELHPVFDWSLPNKVRDFFANNFEKYTVEGPYPMIINRGDTSHVLVSIV